MRGLWVVCITLLGFGFPACAPDRDANVVTPRDRLCAIVGYTQEYYRGEAFPLEGVAVSLDKDIGLGETTAHSDAFGRVILWDAKCGSRPYTATATDRFGRQLTVKGGQPAELGHPNEKLPPRYRRFSFPSSFTYPISPATVEKLAVGVGVYQRTDTGRLVELGELPADVGKKSASILVFSRRPGRRACAIESTSTATCLRRPAPAN